MSLPVVKYRPSAPVMEHLEDENAFMLSNVRSTNALKISSVSGNQENLLDFTLLKDTEQDGHYKVEYNPGHKAHVVSVKYLGSHVAGSPFQLEPDFEEHINATQPQLLQREAEPERALVTQQPRMIERGAQLKGLVSQQQSIKAELDPKSHVVTVSNVPDFDKFIVDTQMGYNIFPGENEQQFRVDYQPASGIHDLSMHYDNQLVDSFRLVPESMKNEFLTTMNTESSIEQEPAVVDQGKGCPPGKPCPNPNPKAVEPMSEPVTEQPQQPMRANRGRLLMSRDLKLADVVESAKQAVTENGIGEFKQGELVFEQAEATPTARRPRGKQIMTEGTVGSAPRYFRNRG